MEIISRADAKAAGLKRYFTGEPCRHGHVVERFLSNRGCVICVPARVSREDKNRYSAKSEAKRRAEGRVKPRADAGKIRKAVADAARHKETYDPKTAAGKWSRLPKETVARYNANAARRRAENREAHRRSRLARVYGISGEAYEAMLASQGGVCAICKKPPLGKKHHARLHVDHDHNTGAVRGLLCGRCNPALGLFDDSRETMKRALQYLSRRTPEETREIVLRCAAD